MTVRGPPGPSGPPGQGWLDQSYSGSGPSTCGCNESLLRLFVKDVNPKLIPGPVGAPGPSGPEGPSGLPVYIIYTSTFILHQFPYPSSYIIWPLSYILILKYPYPSSYIPYPASNILILHHISLILHQISLSFIIYPYL